MISKKITIFWVPFLQNQSTYINFAKVYTYFLRFGPDFHQIKTFGGAVAPQPPTSVN